MHGKMHDNLINIREAKMTEKKNLRLAVINNDNINIEAQERIKQRENVTRPSAASAGGSPSCCATAGMQTAR